MSSLCIVQDFAPLTILENSSAILVSWMDIVELIFLYWSYIALERTHICSLLCTDLKMLQCLHEGDLITTHAGQDKLNRIQGRSKFAEVLVVKILQDDDEQEPPIYLCDFNVNPLRFRLPIYARNLTGVMHSAITQRCQALRDSISVLRLQRSLALTAS